MFEDFFVSYFVVSLISLVKYMYFKKNEALIWTLITMAVLEALMHLGQQH